MLRDPEGKPVRRSNHLITWFLILIILGGLSFLFMVFSVLAVTTNSSQANFSLRGGGLRAFFNATDLFNVTIQASSCEGLKSYLKSLNVTIYDSNGTIVASGLTNDTGFLKIRLPAGVFTTFLSKGYRVVGKKEINVTSSGVYKIPMWVHNISIECIDLKGRVLSNHLVYIYDQVYFYSWNNFTVLTNQTGRLIVWNKTDQSGKAAFKGLWNGTYMIQVVSGRVIYEELIDLQKNESLILTCNKTDLIIRFVSMSDSSKIGDPIPNIEVNIYDSEGNSVFKDYTDVNGYINYTGVYSGRYSIFAEWEGMEIWSGIVDVTGEEIVLKCPVFRLAVKVLDPSGNPVPDAQVTISRVTRRYRTYVTTVIRTGKTDKFGYYTCLLPQSRYEVTCSYGIYRGLTIFDLDSNMNVEIACYANAGVWFSAFIVPLPLLILTIMLERRKLKKPMEMKKYRTMLEKLENLYENGLIEYRLYRKLREEYETKLMELGGREFR
ncbi:TPA: hypothetical protein EYP70_05160 [Candidatus Bathyarchaeota archaeon]|nr:hypothetical protein [Candidatus Bathyarchaeota archaeon]